MNRFFEYFGRGYNPEKVVIKEGCFELRPLKRVGEEFYSNRRLCFVNKSESEELTLSDSVRFMRQITTNGIACSMFYPQGDRNLLLFFVKEGEIIVERGYITDSHHLYYVFDGELRCLYNRYNERVIISKEDFARCGYAGEIYYEDESFWIPSMEVELIPQLYYRYDGTITEEPKRQRIAREIMIQIDMFMAKSFTHQHVSNEKRQILSKLTWEAQSADLADVKMLYDLEASEDNLESENALQINKIISLFEEYEKTTLFPRYMEFFFTAYEQLSRYKEWSSSQMPGGKMLTEDLDDFHMKIYRKTHKNMAMITEKLVARSDFEALLNNYLKFEVAVSDVLKELKDE